MKTRIKEVLEAMRKKGYRASASREAILSFLTKSRRPVSAVDLLGKISQKGKTFNKATVYREIETLRREGYLRELTLRNDIAFYELPGEHHHHLVCVSCGDIRSIQVTEPEEWSQSDFFRRMGFVISDHSLEFFGKCRECRKAGC